MLVGTSDQCHFSFFTSTVGGGNFIVHPFQSLGDDVRNRQIAEPFFIRGNDEPGRVIGTALGESVFIGADIIVPEVSLGEIRL